MAALAADMEAAAGGGREVEKGFAALLRGDGGGLTHSGCSRLLGQWRRGGQEPPRTSLRLIHSPCLSGIFTTF